MLKRFSGQKTHIMLVYALLAFLSMAIFGSLHIVEGNSLVGSLELAGAAAVFFVMLGLRITGNVEVARTGFLLTMITLLVVMLVTGGTQGTGIFWFFMFPVAAFFLAGAGEGVFWMVFLGVIIGLMWVAGKTTSMPLYYNSIEIRQLLVTLAVVTVGLYVYQRFRERSEAASRRSQSDLKAYLRQMELLHAKMDRTKSEFVALASHQLRTPISGIRWYGEMLLSGDAGDLTGEQRECVQHIEDSNLRLATIVDTMLLIASLDSGHLDIKLEPVDLLKLSHTVLAEERKKFADKQLEVTEKYEDDLPKAQLDKHIADVILRNVFSNALKYTPSGGKVEITISRYKDAPKESPKKNRILIGVADNGYGIPKNQQVEVFGKMFRADNAKAKETDGTGLGLHVVKALLDRIGGKIWFESDEGRGTNFWISLPLDGLG